MSDAILVTGANGFIGRAVVTRLHQDGHRVRAATRTADKTALPSVAEVVTAPDLSSSADWTERLRGVGSIVHCAAQVPTMNAGPHASVCDYRRTNVAGTLALAEQAARCGVHRFVFISSAKVNGEQTEPGRKFRPDDPPHPQDPYGESKLEAEQSLLALADRTGLELVVLRPPLVYGKGAKGNFNALCRLVASRVPLPFGSIHDNRRSLLALDNLVDLIATSLAHPRAANQVFLASDGEDLSTADLVERLGMAMGRPARLFRCPPDVLQWAAKVSGKHAFAQRLLGSLQLDIEKTRRLLDWTPPIGVDDALRGVFTAQPPTIGS